MNESTQHLIDAILAENPSHKPFLDQSLDGLPEEVLDELASYLGYCQSRGVGLTFLAESYNTIVQDTFSEQIYFMRHKKYRFSTYAEVAGSVYQNEEYMKKYMYGLAITLFLWPAHRQLKQFFERTLPKTSGGRYLEIGPGHGFYFMRALDATQFDSFTAVDISPASVDMARDIVSSGYFGEFSGYSIVCQDFLSADLDGERFDALVMGEVLEHVEEPGTFLRRIRELTHPESYVYVSTCMNAPAVDHIALFRSVAELEAIINDAGLRIADQCLVPYPGLTVEETERKQLALNIGAVLSHA